MLDLDEVTPLPDNEPADFEPPYDPSYLESTDEEVPIIDSSLLVETQPEAAQNKSLPTQDFVLTPELQNALAVYRQWAREVEASLPSLRGNRRLSEAAFLEDLKGYISLLTSGKPCSLHEQRPFVRSLEVLEEVQPVEVLEEVKPKSKSKAKIKTTIKSKEVTVEVPVEPVKVSLEAPKVRHKAKKGEKLTAEQIAENKANKKAEWMASPAGQQWLRERWQEQLFRALGNCKTTEDKDLVLEKFKGRGSPQSEFVDSLISKYDIRTTGLGNPGWLFEWVQDNPGLAKSFGEMNPEKGKELDQIISKFIVEICNDIEEEEYRGAKATDHWFTS